MDAFSILELTQGLDSYVFVWIGKEIAVIFMECVIIIVISKYIGLVYQYNKLFDIVRYWGKYIMNIKFHYESCS